MQDLLEPGWAFCVLWLMGGWRMGEVKYREVAFGSWEMFIFLFFDLLVVFTWLRSYNTATITLCFCVNVIVRSDE